MLWEVLGIFQILTADTQKSTNDPVHKWLNSTGAPLISIFFFLYDFYSTIFQIITEPEQINLNSCANWQMFNQGKYIKLKLRSRYITLLTFTHKLVKKKNSMPYCRLLKIGCRSWSSKQYFYLRKQNPLTPNISGFKKANSYDSLVCTLTWLKMKFMSNQLLPIYLCLFKQRPRT